MASLKAEFIPTFPSTKRVGDYAWYLTKNLPKFTDRHTADTYVSGLRPSSLFSSYCPCLFLSVPVQFLSNISKECCRYVIKPDGKIPKLLKGSLESKNTNQKQNIIFVQTSRILQKSCIIGWKWVTLILFQISTVGYRKWDLVPVSQHKGWGLQTWSVKSLCGVVPRARRKGWD